jgi:hypothetical protein
MRHEGDVDTDRDSPIYPEGYEAGTFNGPVEADIDLTEPDDPEPVFPPAKKPKSSKSSKPKSSKSIGTSSRGQQMEDESDDSEPFTRRKSKDKGKGKAKGKVKGKANSTVPSYSRRAAFMAGESSGDDDDNESSEDEHVMDLCSSSGAGRSADVVDLCDSESSSDKSSKK